MKKLKALLISAFFFVVLVSYQNCGTGQQGALFDAQTFSTLPYEVAIDQIAYMSCAEQGNVANDLGVFFSFRAGAYGTSTGIRLTEDFLYETRRSNNSVKMDILYEDKGTSLARLQFAIRKQASLNSMFINEDSGEGIEEIDFDYVFGELGSDEMSASLLTLPTNQYMNYWSAGGITKDAYFQGSLVFNSSESLAQQLRNFMDADGLLVLGYAESTKPESLRSPAFYEDVDDDETAPIATNEALGLGFKLKFKQPLPNNWGYGGTSPHKNMPKRVLESVTEYDLSTPKSAGNSMWTCPTTLQLRVPFPDDIWGVSKPHDPSDDTNFEANPGTSSFTYLCPQRSDTHADNIGTSARAARLAIIRRSLPVSDWYVNVAYQCAIPKRYTKGSCYGIDSGTNDTRSPEYNVTAKCNPDVNSTGVGVCSHFVSICYKE